MPEINGLNILKMLEDHLDPEIEALESEAEDLEAQREVIDARISKLKAIRRITNVTANKQQEGKSIRTEGFTNNDSG